MSAPWQTPPFMAEKDYYPAVERWLRTTHGCFHTEQTRGLGSERVKGNIDVVGVRHVGGDLRGDVELIGCEVKDDEPFLKSAGQARAYGVMVHRCYLISVDEFNGQQRRVAEHLQIGLALLSGDQRTRCSEIQSAPLVQPIPALADELLEKMGLARCAICQSVFRTRHPEHRSGITDAANMVRDGGRHGIGHALDTEKGFIYWLDHVQEQRRDERTLARRGDDTYYDRRYVCASCIQGLALGRG